MSYCIIAGDDNTTLLMIIILLKIILLRSTKQSMQHTHYTWINNQLYIIIMQIE